METGERGHGAEMIVYSVHPVVRRNRLTALSSTAGRLQSALVAKAVSYLIGI